MTDDCSFLKEEPAEAYEVAVPRATERRADRHLDARGRIWADRSAHRKHAAELNALNRRIWRAHQKLAVPRPSDESE